MRRRAKKSVLRYWWSGMALFAVIATGAICRAGLNDQGRCKGSPYLDSRHQKGAQGIPGPVECAYYDRGSEGVAYHDADAKNNGSGSLNPADGTYLNGFRMDEGVDISYTKFHDQIDDNSYNLVKPPENQLYVGWTEPGEWFKITVEVAHAGVYGADLLLPQTAAEPYRST
jgi:hypothetical protein